MGHVYLGREPMLDRLVALKFIGTSDPTHAARERFLVEARAIARLNHPNVVGVYRIGEVDGAPYLAYEFIAGQSLDAIAKPVSWRRALDIGIGVARGLGAAHAAGVLHRDIKPANVMLDERNQIKLLDFGLAKLVVRGGEELEAEPPSTRRVGFAATDVTVPLASKDSDTVPIDRASRLTAPGAVMGTPLYMAPEVWGGASGSAQSDVWSLGLVLSELLAGRHPRAHVPSEDFARVTQGTELQPIASMCPDVPQPFADLVDRCLRLVRAERYASAELVRDELEVIRSVSLPFASGGDVDAHLEAEAMLVSASFASVMARSDAFAASMYERLFAVHPEVRRLFPEDMTSLRRKLMGALHVIVENLQKPDRLVPLLEDLGRRHAKYGVEAAHLDFVGEALVGALGGALGDAFTAETRDAWVSAYGRIAQAMQRGLAGEPLTV